MNIHELRTEGDIAVEDLEFFTQHELGYKREVFRFCSPIEKLLSDNSGLIETIHDWIKDNLLEECPYCDNYCPSLDEDDVCEEYFTEVLGGTLDLVEHKINILDKNTMVDVEIPTIRARDTVEGIVYKFVESGDYCIRYSNGGRFLFCSNLSGFCIPITKADDVVEVCSINEFSKGEF